MKNYSFSKTFLNQTNISKKNEIIQNDYQYTRIFFRSYRFANPNSLDSQRKIMHFVYDKLKLKTLEDFKKVSKSSFCKYGGKKIFAYYKENFENILQKLYPHYPWDFAPKILSKYGSFREISEQRKFMDNLSLQLGLQNKLEWMEVSIQKLRKNGGNSILYYNSDNMYKLLSNVYPEVQWDEGRIKEFELILKQRSTMKKIARKLKVKSINDWLKVPISTISRRGGNKLLKYYSNDKVKLLSSIYPKHDWDFMQMKYNPAGFFKPMENQQFFMEKLYKVLKFESLEDFIFLRKKQILKYGGQSLLSYHYRNNLEDLLSTIYPNFPWDFSNLLSKRQLRFKKHFHYYTEKLKIIQMNFKVSEMKDWYRIRLRTDYINLYEALSTVFPHMKWDMESFIYRSKKTMQRMLYLKTKSIFHKFDIFENYRHPKVIYTDYFFPVEYDVFFPSLNLAFEYQGEQHYNDMPSGFGYVEYYRAKDDMKNSLSIENSVTLIIIPYWWDKCELSLIPTIGKQFHNLFILDCK